MPRAPALLALAALLAARASGQEPKANVPTTTMRSGALAAIALSIKSRAIQDSRCYLMNGGAVESFFISEDTPVGSIIGTLSVNGDPREGDGDIELSLQEKAAAVGIAPGSKNLTLLRALDREELAGPSNVYVNVRCDRRRTADPSFVIPVSVRVWDVNDNAPVWAGTPYRARLSELTAVGSRLLQAVRAADADQPGAHATVRYSVLPGPHAEYFGFVNELDSILVVKKPLDYETLSNFTVTLRAQDGGEPPLHNDTTLEVEVLDADDQNPKFDHDSYTAIVPEDYKEGDELEISPEPISAFDQDTGINAPLYYGLAGEHRDLFSVQRDTGVVTVGARLASSNVKLPVTLVVKATQYDNADRYALATLTVARRGGRRVRFLQRAYAAAVPEDAAVGSVLLALTTDRFGGENPLQFFVSDRDFLEKFAINSMGELLLRRALDYETHAAYRYQVMVTDGVVNDTASINITVLNVNDWEPRFRYPQYEFRVEAAEGAAAGAEGGGGGLLPVGRVEAHDGDAGDRVALGVRGPNADMFYINDMGEMYLKSEALTALNSSVIHVVATARDSGVPPKQTSVPVIVHVGAALRRAAGAGGALLPALLAAALALLALLVLLLLAYIYRARRAKASSGGEPAGGFVRHEKEAAGGAPAAGGGGGSLLSVSAGASTILADSSSSLDLRGDTLPSADGGRSAAARQSQRFPARGRVAPAAALSDHVGGGAGGRSGVAWPAATIPARVKKLSWDDADAELPARGGRALTAGSAQEAGGDIHDATNPAVQDHMNLTVYF